MTKEEIKELVLKRGLDVYDVIDVVIELNGLIGVGLITLGDNLKDYTVKKIQKRSTESWLNE